MIHLAQDVARDQSLLRELMERDQLLAFDEPRYLHQTVVRDGAGAQRFYDDLPEALATERPEGRWRVHFHVPLFLEAAGAVGTTQHEVATCLEVLADEPVTHWEVETYAWDVLPEPLRSGTLAEGIARELDWLVSVAPEGYFRSPP